MIKIDLVTGFLGAGKTTFIKKYAEYLIAQKLHIGIIENDFGAINVDMLLLQNLEEEFCTVEPIVGGNVVSDWKRRFKAKLISLFMQGVDHVIVEPSGIYDVDAFFEVLYDEPLDSWYEIGNIITIVDADLDTKLSEQAEFLLMSQIAYSGTILFSKIKTATKMQKKNTIEFLGRLLEKYDCDQTIEAVEKKILSKDWDTLSKDDYQLIMNAKWCSPSYRRLVFDNNDAFTSLFFMDVTIAEENIEDIFESIIQDAKCGNILRMKGFLQKDDGKWIQINATREHFEKEVVNEGQAVIIVIGQGLNKEVIDERLNKKK